LTTGKINISGEVRVMCLYLWSGNAISNLIYC